MAQGRSISGRVEAKCYGANATVHGHLLWVTKPWREATGRMRKQTADRRSRARR